MANIPEIAQLGATVLRLRAQVITDIQCAETQRIIETMLDTLATTQGVGIAAPQISISNADYHHCLPPYPALSVRSTDGTGGDD